MEKDPRNLQFVLDYFKTQDMYGDLLKGGYMHRYMFLDSIRIIKNELAYLGLSILDLSKTV